MNIKDLRKYIFKRNRLAGKLAENIMESIVKEIPNFPEEGMTDLGDSICNASNDLAETIICILEEYTGDEEDGF